jgi:hypothetical protein
VGLDAGSGHGDEFRTRVHWADGVDFQTDFHFVGYFTVSNVYEIGDQKPFLLIPNDNQQNFYPVLWS